MCRASLSQLSSITSVFSSYNFTGNYSCFIFVCGFFFRFVCYLLIQMVTGELSVHADEKS